MLRIFDNCEELQSLEKSNADCWSCIFMDLCQSCKTMGCNNEEKDTFIVNMTSMRGDKL